MKKLIIMFWLLCFVCLPLVSASAVTGQEAKPREPKGGFTVRVENGVEVVHSRSVVLLINGGVDADRMAISNGADFTVAGIVPFQSVVEWILPESEGEYVVHVKVYTRHGVASPAFFDTIIYQKEIEKEDGGHYTQNGGVLMYGDLFKKQGISAVYYYGYDDKRYVFPQEQVFYSWYTAADYARIKIVSSETLASIPIGGNVVYRPGSRLVKVQSDSKVYAVGFKGELFWLPSETLARELYGDSWFRRVVDIPDILFGNYNVSKTTIGRTAPPSGYIFSLPDSASVYIKDGSRIRAFLNEEVLRANGYSFVNVKPLAEVTTTLGDLIGARELRFVDAAQRPVVQM